MPGRRCARCSSGQGAHQQPASTSGGLGSTLQLAVALGTHWQFARHRQRTASAGVGLGSAPAASQHCRWPNLQCRGGVIFHHEGGLG